MRRLLTATLLAGTALATTGAVPPEEQAMLDAFDRVLTAMAVVGLALVLLAKAVAALLRSGLVDFPTP